MGLIAALLDKKGEDVSDALLRMLGLSSPTRGDGYGFSTPQGVQAYHNLPESIDTSSGIMLGYKLNKIMPSDPMQPVEQRGYTMIFDGRLWTRAIENHQQKAFDMMGPDPADGIRKLIESGVGSFSVVVADIDRILCGRDHVGVVPLYYGESETLMGAASNRKMLWSVGMEPQPLLPGHLMELSKDGAKVSGIKKIEQPETRRMPMEEAVEIIDDLLMSSTEARSRGVLSASLGFSGGIDSALLAYYLKKSGVRVDLVTVGVEGSKEFEGAERAADDLGLPIRLEAFPPSRVEEDLDSVLLSVEEPDSMKVCVALPLGWVAERAAEKSSPIVFSGNGSDELFGGYMKYVRDYASRGGEVAKTMFRDVSEAHATNYERDFKVCADHGLELRLPFADPRLIEFGLSLPLHLRVAHNGEPRKPLLRALARGIGLSQEVIFRQKKAIQYSTGVDGTLKALARRRGIALSQYLSDMFEVVKRRYVQHGF